MFPHRLFSCFLSCTILVLLVIVHIGARWAVYSYTLHPFYLGLWVICTEEKCSFLKDREVKMEFTRAFMVIAVLTCLIAVLCSVEWRYLFKSITDSFPQGLIAGVCNIMTGIFVLISVVLFEVSMKESKPSEQPKFPHKLWAFHTSCAICALGFLTGIYDLVICKLSLWGTPTPALEAAPEAAPE